MSECRFGWTWALIPAGLMAMLIVRIDPRYAVRVANRDVLWWTDSDGRHGINVLGTLEIAE